MNTTSECVPANDAVSDFLGLLRRSHILRERRCDEIESGLARHIYPNDPRDLATALVQEASLTEYQARRLLEGRPDGLIIGRYVILDRIGSGGMGRVYKAKHAMMGRLVALKLLLMKEAGNKSRVARFRREMQMVGSLDHPNIVRAFDADRIGDVPYIVMEYIPGVTLEALLRSKGKIPVAETLWYGAQAAKGLAHAHEQGIVHRDVKPSNILLNKERLVKILDLGLGVFLERGPDDEYKTEAGATVGTMDYLSPEQACMKQVDGRSDIYSLGCTLFHLMSGRLPFEGISSMERLAVRIAGQVSPIAEVMPGLPRKVSNVLEMMIARDPADRFQTAGEAAEALASLVRTRTPSAFPGAPAPPALPVPLKPATPCPAAAPSGRLASIFPSHQVLRTATPSRPAPRISDLTRSRGLGLTLKRWSAVLSLAALGLAWSAVVLSRADNPTATSGEMPSVTSSAEAQSLVVASAAGVDREGDRLAEDGKWAEAATAFGKAAASRPGDLFLIHRRALALMNSGDLDEYRRLCVETSREFTGSSNQGAIDVMRACCLLPGLLPESEWAVSLNLDALRGDQKAAWRLYILGLVYFRLGRCEEAVLRLEDSVRVDPMWAGSALNYPVLSMAYGQLGQSGKARDWLNRANLLRDGMKRGIRGEQAAGAPWYDRAEFAILAREANDHWTPGESRE